jgi:drug/metabolite transporter (DMT)-like permease
VASGLAALLVSTVPLFVVLLEWIGPRVVRIGAPKRLVAVGIFAGLSGIVILIGPSDLLGERVDLIGAGALVVASLLWSFGSTLSRKLPVPSSPALGTAMQMLAGGGLLLVVSGLTGELSRVDPAAVSAKSLLALAYLIVFGAIVAFSAYVFLLRNVAVAKVATYAYVNPIVALLLGWAMAGEALSARTLVAGAIILGAVILITTQRRAPRVRPAEPDPATGVEALDTGKLCTAGKS